MKVYTSITGQYDRLRDPPESVCAEDIEFHAFLDKPQASDVWKPHVANTSMSTSRLNAKHHKVLPHLSFPDCDISLWIDGSIEICPDTVLQNLAHQFLREADLAVFAHGKRYCIYQEAIYCLHHQLDDPAAIRNQVFRYTQEGYQANQGLAECTVLLRRHTEHLKQFSELWWQEIRTGSVRDQLSFPYVVRKTGLKVKYFPGTINAGKWFRRREHLLSREYQAPLSTCRLTSTVASD